MELSAPLATLPCCFLAVFLSSRLLSPQWFTAHCHTGQVWKLTTHTHFQSIKRLKSVWTVYLCIVCSDQMTIKYCSRFHYSFNFKIEALCERKIEWVNSSHSGDFGRSWSCVDTAHLAGQFIELLGLISSATKTLHDHYHYLLDNSSTSPFECLCV